MLISEKLKIIFVHVPKTGGMSVTNALYRASDDVHRLGQIHLPAFYRHPSIKWGDYTSFAFVRNPWDRAVSAYLYSAKTLGTFEEFLHWHDYRNGHSWPLFKPQTRWVNDDKGRCFVSKVGRFERLQEDFAAFCPTASPLPHLNSTEHKHYREFYTPQTRDWVAAKFADDIAQFGYTF